MSGHRANSSEFVIMTSSTEKTKPSAEISFEIRVTLNEEEVRALDALVCYGTDSFLKVFFEHMGKHYLSPHESGIRSLFHTVNREISPFIWRIDNARKAFIQNK